MRRRDMEMSRDKLYEFQDKAATGDPFAVADYLTGNLLPEKQYEDARQSFRDFVAYAHDLGFKVAVTTLLPMIDDYEDGVAGQPGDDYLRRGFNCASASTSASGGIQYTSLLSTTPGAANLQQARRMDTEDLSMAHVAFANGCVASVVNSMLSIREESYLRFDFEWATVELTHLYGYGDDDWRITPALEHADEVMDAWRAFPDVRTLASA